MTDFRAGATGQEGSAEMVKDLHSRLDDCRARDLDDVADEVLRLQAELAALRERLAEADERLQFSKE